MEIITNVAECSFEKTAVAIGKFEGLHLGHQKLIKKIIEKQPEGFIPVAFTFDVSPRIFFGEGGGILFTREERRSLFAQWQLPCLVEVPFTRELADMEAEVFIEEVLCGCLHAAYLVVGRDFCFGKNRRGDVGMLQAYAAKGFFQLEVVEKETAQGQEISSTQIRKQLQNGSMEAVADMLGFPYFLEGVVVEGNRLGRTWGIPTANIMVNQSKQIPPHGVYFSRVWVGQECFAGITNLGNKPTIGEGYQEGAETFLFDFDREIYSEKIRVELLHFLRKEHKFDDLEGLKKQLQEDISKGMAYFVNDLHNF